MPNLFRYPRDKFMMTAKLTARLTDRLSGLFGYKIKLDLPELSVIC